MGRKEIEYQEFKTKQQQADELKLSIDLERRLTLARDYRESIENLERRKAAEIEAEDKERREMLEHFAQSNKIDQLSEHKRRMKVLAHSREVERILQDRRDLKEKERCRELEELRSQKEEEDRAAMIIQDERQRLLQAHGLFEQGAKLA